VPITALAAFTAAMIAPWLCGWLLLRNYLGTPRWEQAAPGERAWLLGYGFFLGYALTGALLWVTARLLDTFPFFALLAFLLVACAALALRLRLRGTGGAAAGASAGPASPAGPHARFDAGAGFRAGAGGRALGIAVLLAVAAHLLLPLLEVVHRPVFPWDAWLNWMYRAKVWYLTDGLATFAEPYLWAAGVRDSDYTVAGAHYPALVPLIAVWAALGLGQWSETLIGIPTVLAGLALTLGFYGQCRASGLSPLRAGTAAYVLLSVPLLGTHLALAGQADIWLSCFAGLGIVAALRGCSTGDRQQIILGLGFCVVGLFIKLEGALWLVLALLLLAAARLGRGATLAALGAFATLALASWLLPADALQSLAAALERRWPALVAGTGQLLSERELADDYLQNYLLGGSWHLAGWLSAGCFLALVLGRGWRGPSARRLALTFFSLQGGALLVIFGFSHHGAWAEDWTAINRLPLQLIAAHVYLWFTLGLSAAGRSGGTGGRSAAARAATPGSAGAADPTPAGAAGFASRDDAQTATPGVPLTLAAVAACLLAVLLLALLLLGGEARPSRVFPAADLRAALGGGVLRGDRFWLQRYQGGLAVASSGPVSISAGDLPLVEVATGGGNRARASFFWRPAADPGNLQQRELPVRGTALLDLRDALQPGARIVEFGVLSYRDSDGAPLSVGAVRFHAPGAGTLLRKFSHDWTTPVYWSQRSAHWTAAGRADAPLSLPGLAGCAAVLFTLGALLYGRRRPRALAAVLWPGLLALWVLLDARWTVNLARQGLRTVSDYPLLSAVSHRFSNDGATRDAVQAALAASGTGGALILVGERADLRYQLLRAQYHAAPRPALVPEPPAATAFRAGDRLLLLRSDYSTARAPGEAPPRDLRGIAALLAPRGLTLGPGRSAGRALHAAVLPGTVD
jgi:hypothetical protein